MQRTEHEAEDHREWAVLGDEGAVNFLVFPQDKEKHPQGTQTACCIGVHAVKKLATLPRRGKCDILPGGHCYETLHQKGAHELWVLSRHGKEPQVIWEVLEGWYNMAFGS